MFIRWLSSDRRVRAWRAVHRVGWVLQNHLIADGRGQLWMASYGGIVRVNKKELHRCADGRATAAAFYVYWPARRPGGAGVRAVD